MIEIKNIAKVYQGKGRVISNLSLEIGQGQVVGLFGANGAGKSTILRCIADMTSLSNGEVLIDGLPARDQSQLVSYITEEGSFFPHMTIREYGDFMQSFFPQFDRARYDRLVNFFELSQRDKAGRLSRGQRSKLEISAGMSKNAKYILMDEPFLGKDIFTRRDFLRLMAVSLKTDETIVIATHLIDEVEQFIDRAVIIRYGRIYADKTREELTNDGENLESLMQTAAGYDENRYKKLLD